MVRELKIGMAHMKELSGHKELPKERAYVTDLLIVEHEKGSQSAVKKLSVVGLPFWIVQTSSSTSVILAPSQETGIDFTYTEGSHISEIRRILRSEVTEPSTVKDAADKIIVTLTSSSTTTEVIPGMVDPSLFLSVRDYITPASIEEKVPLIEGSITSQDALNASEKFQNMRDSLKMKVDELEALRKLANEVLGGQHSVIENIIATEQRRYKPQLETMKEKLDMDIKSLRKKKDDKLYSLGEERMMKLRTKSVEFSRQLSSIEKVLDVMVQLTKDTRIDISKKGDKVREAVGRFSELSSSLKEYHESIPDILSDLDEESKKLIEEVEKIENEFQKKQELIESEFEKDSADKQARLEQFEKDMKTKFEELESTEKIVAESVMKVDEILEKQIFDIQSDLLKITAKSLNNSDIPEVAPLTRLTVHCLIMVLPDNSMKLFIPYSVPDDRLDSSLKYQPIDRKFDESLVSYFEKWKEQDSKFLQSLNESIKTGHIFDLAKIDTLFHDGLDKLQMTQHLKDGTKDKIEAIWNRYHDSS
ncbi:MAG: hypothetical protein GF411_15030 [Candidatus Lokiarchaeota archaeon]|nr:hypothetical protein [Candidatus Lokiarchaeota archaeon]